MLRRKLAARQIEDGTTMHVKVACIVADHGLDSTYGQEEECDEM